MRPSRVLALFLGLAGLFFAVTRPRGRRRQPSDGTSPLFTVDVRYPGRRIQFPESSAAFDATRIVWAIDRELSEAVMALNLFIRAQSDWPRVQELDDRRESKTYEKALSRYMREHGMDPLTADHEAGLEVMRARWAAGRMPDDYLRRLPFTHARTFVSSLTKVRRLLLALIKIPGVPNGGAVHVDQLDIRLPGLKDLRDSSEHSDERVRGLAYGDPIPARIILLENLMGSRFVSTAADGQTVAVDVTAETLTQVVSCIQAVIDSLSWEGRAEVKTL